MTPKSTQRLLSPSPPPSPLTPTPSSPTLAVSWSSETSTEEDLKRKDRRTSKLITLLHSTRQLNYHTSTFASTSWHVIVGVAAFLDFAATVLASYFPEDDGIVTVKKDGLFFDRYTKEHVVTDDPFHHDFLQWLETWYVEIGIVFSILWFIDAFVKAQWKRDEKLIKLDRKRLIEYENSLDQEHPIKPHKHRLRRLRAEAWDTYYWSVGLQLILLPVGFYIFAFRFASHPMDVVSSDERSSTYYNETMDTDDELTMRSTHCVLFAFLHYISVFTHRLVGEGIRTKRTMLYKKAMKRVTRFALRHPRLFHYRLRTYLRTVRWLKYLAPLIGAFNKLLGNIQLLLKRHRQRLAAKKALRRRKKHWKELGSDEQRQVGAIRIQSAFRGMQTRKAVRCLQILQGSKRTMVALKLQKAFRASLARARTRIMKKKRELKRLEMQAAATKKYDRATMSDDDRRRMYQLQDELHETAKELVNKKLLLRPNSKFAVIWKAMFVVGVLFECSQVVLMPRLKKFKDPTTGKPLHIGKFLEKHVIPSPMSEWTECAPWLVEPNQRNKSQFFPRVRKRMPSSSKMRPWYCRESFERAHQWLFIEVLRFLLTKTVVIIGIVCFLDVFVTFFTGELHPESGMFQPKPFIKRWLVPGLALQLLTNPQMETTSRHVMKLLKSVSRVGPVRAWRWTAALFYPLFKIIARVLEAHVWQPLVRNQNTKLQHGKRKYQRRNAITFWSKRKNIHSG